MNVPIGTYNVQQLQNKKKKIRNKTILFHRLMEIRATITLKK